MNKKIICISIIGMFLLTSFAGIVSGETIFQNDSEEQNDKAVLKTDLRICTGKFYSNGHIEFITDPDFTGTKEIPHGSDVTVYCEFENVDTLTPGEFWKFRTEVYTTGYGPGHNEGKTKVIYDEWGDDSQTGTIEITIPLEKFILGANGIHHWSDGYYEIPWLNYTDYCCESAGIDVVLLNENPNKPSSPEGPTNIQGKYGETTKHTYEVDIAVDPDGDEINYKWRLDREKDDYHQEKTTDEPYVELEIPYDRSWGKEIYHLKVQAQDSYLTLSEWSDPLEITVRRVKSRNHELQFDFTKLFSLLEQFLLNLR